MINQVWFDSLTQIGLREHLLFLANLPTQVERIANFGCWSGDEPFALLWTLNSSEIVVVEIKQEHIKTLQEEMDIISHRYPQSLQERTVNVLCRDMSQSIPELPSEYFDLAYCENVLYNLQKQPDALEYAISQMLRVTKQGGYIIAVEPKFGVEYKRQEIEFVGKKIPRFYPLNEPRDMSPLFESKGLTKIDVTECPDFAYCYQR
jgi:SAM-dependent methyltransferase